MSWSDKIRLGFFVFVGVFSVLVYGYAFVRLLLVKKYPLFHVTSRPVITLEDIENRDSEYSTRVKTTIKRTNQYEMPKIKDLSNTIEFKDEWDEQDQVGDCIDSNWCTYLNCKRCKFGNDNC